MADTKTTAETTRTIDGTELVRLATPGANWKSTLAAIFTAIGLGPIVATPTTNTSPGTPYSVAFDTMGNLYISWATNTWAKYVNTAPFGITGGTYVAEDGVSDYVAENGTDIYVTEA